MLDHIRIVLVNTSHPGNIGSAARAMKTMGLSKLYLVDPVSFPHAKAREMAVGAADVLDNAIVVDSLDAAIADCALVMGTSARIRTVPWPLFSPREMAEKAREQAAHLASGPIAILFGREQSGLTNEELQRCHFHVHVPANPEYTSLNLASAVQIMAYELRLASMGSAATPAEGWDYRPATVDEMERFFVHLQEVLVAIDFLKPSAPRKLMARLRRLFLRTQVDVMEMNILRGMLTAIEEALARR